jgi:nitroreductase
MKTFQEAVEYRRSVRIFKNEPIDEKIVEKCIKNATLSPNSSNMQMTQYIHVTSPKLLKKLTHCCLSQSAAKTAQQMVVLVIRKENTTKRAKQNYDFMLAQEHTTFKSHKNGFKQILLYYSKVMPFMYAPDFLGIFGRIKFALLFLVGLFRPIVRQVMASDIRVISHKSAGIAAQTFMLSMAAEGYDTCPMEGLDSVRVKKALGLPYSAEINMIISCGIRDEEGVWGKQFRVPFGEVYEKR